MNRGVKRSHEDVEQETVKANSLSLRTFTTV